MNLVNLNLRFVQCKSCTHAHTRARTHKHDGMKFSRQTPMKTTVARI